MERDIPIDGDLTYKIPTGLPGCEYLIDWEIDDALLVISNNRGEICHQEISLSKSAKSVSKFEVGIVKLEGVETTHLIYLFSVPV